MLHWRVSSALGLLMTGRYRPVCAVVYAARDCAARRGFLRFMDALFDERDHCRRIWLTDQVSRAIR